MSKKVVVTNISEKASEKVVKDFFLFCGKIKDFELIKEECSDTQIAYVTFERDTAAKTALMLTGAVIVDLQITVRPADDTGSCGDDVSDDASFGQEDKPKGFLIAEILASGFSMQDAILEKGLEFDSKFGLSCAFKQYLNQIQDNLKNLDKRYQVTDIVATRATDINDKYSVLNRTKYVIDQASCKVNDFLQSPYGKYISDYLLSTRRTVSDVRLLARRLADEKKGDKGDKDFDYTPSHSHPEDHPDYPDHSELVASEN